MLFNSYEFLFAYLPVVFLIFFGVAKKNYSHALTFLGLASLFFYGWFSIKALPILLGSIVVNYLFGINLSSKQNKRLLIFALIFNLGLLSFFKYANFFIENSNAIITLTSQNNWRVPILEIALPIGISFFTFTQIAFLVDCYQGKVQEKKFSYYLLFVTYFPHLIAGPVLHHAQMMPQFSDKKIYKINYEKIALGIVIFTIGLAKKILIANPLGEYADIFFNSITPESRPTFTNSWLGALAYTFQIYFDFSGYTDMAIGISLLFGITLPINFNSPYKSTNIIEFWRRWHISLSTFLKEYLYIPLGGGRNGAFKRYRNLLITMLLGGLWHGAAWNFVFWGLTHGLLLTINHLWRNFHKKMGSTLQINNSLCWLITFIVIVCTWVIFRANNLEQIEQIYRGLIGLNGLGNIQTDWIFNHLRPQNLFKLLAISFLIIWLGTPSHLLIGFLGKINLMLYFIPNQMKYYLSSICIFIFLMYCINLVGNYNPFLYFQF